MKLDQVLLHGDRADQPDPEDVAGGSLYCVDDESFIIEQAQGAVGARTWEPYSPTGGSATAIDALTGDVTATGPGTVAATIANDAVTFAKMQNITSDRLLGRDTAASGNVEEISVGGGLEFTGTAAIQIANDGVVTVKILDANVTLAKMANLAADRLIGRGNGGGTGVPQAISLGSGLALTGTVLDVTGGGGGITQLTGDVTAGPGSGSQAATIANNAVTTAKLLDANVTLAKIVDLVADTLIGRGNGGGTGVPQVITLGTGLSMAGTVLSASGGPSPGMVFLGRRTASASASLAFTSLITSTYDNYVFEFNALMPATTGTEFYMRCSTNNGSSYDSGGNYAYLIGFNGTNGSSSFAQNSSGTEVRMSTPVSSNTARGGVSGTMRWNDPLNASSMKSFTGQQMFSHDSGFFFQCWFAGTYRNTAAMNAIQFFFSSGNIASGTITMYGLTH